MAFGIGSGQYQGYYNGIMRYLSSRTCDWDICFNANRFFRPMDERTLKEEFIEGFDGVFFCSPCSRRCIDLALRARKCVVVLDPDEPPPKSTSLTVISIDEKRLAETVVGMLMRGENYASYAYFKHQRNGTWADARYERIRAGFRAKGLECGAYEAPTDFRAIRDLPKPAAVIASNDITAHILAKHCKKNGIRIPHEIALIGIDDEPIICTHTSPPLTSVHPDWESAGLLAAKNMNALLSGRKSRPHTEYGIRGVVERMSTGASSPAGQLVLKAEEIIRQNISRPLNATSLASLMKISKRLLTLRYRQIRNTTPLRAIHTAKLAEVRRLLLGSSFTLDKISELCGFNDSSQLKKLFRRTYGCSMNDWRKSRSTVSITAHRGFHRNCHQ